jgi:hypothetical protein
VHAVDLAHQRVAALVLLDHDVVVVAEFLDDHRLAEERDLFLALGELARQGDLLLRIHLADVAVAELAEHHHVLVLLVEEVVQVLGDVLVLLRLVEAVRQALHQRALALQHQAEEVAQLELGQSSCAGTRRARPRRGVPWMEISSGGMHPGAPRPVGRAR